MHAFVGDDHSEELDNDWTIGVLGVVFKGTQNVIRAGRAGELGNPFHFSIVRDEEWSGSTCELHQVDYISANGA